jgi:hypothetical protein
MRAIGAMPDCLPPVPVRSGPHSFYVAIGVSVDGKRKPALDAFAVTSEGRLFPIDT